MSKLVLIGLLAILLAMPFTMANIYDDKKEIELKIKELELKPKSDNLAQTKLNVYKQRLIDINSEIKERESPKYTRNYKGSKTLIGYVTDKYGVIYKHVINWYKGKLTIISEKY